MKLVNVDENVLKKYFDEGKTVLYLKLVPYKNNTCIKAYSENNEPIGDIEEKSVQEYINKNSVVMFLNQTINDDTGLLEYTVSTMI